MINPLISIITSVYNGEKYLEGTIKSIANQTYRNFEYIIIDGGSEDKTLEIIKKYSNKITFWQSEPDKGIYDAWNKGLKHANGEWICFVGSDDILLADAIESYVNEINKYQEQEIDYVSSKIHWVTNDLNFIKEIGSKWTWDIFIRHMNVAHVGSLHHKSLFLKYGNFDQSYKIAGDYEFLLRPKSELKALFIDQVTALMRHEDGVSSQGNKVHFETAKAKAKTGKRNIILVGYECGKVILLTFIKRKLEELGLKPVK